MTTLEVCRLSAEAVGHKETDPPLANEYGVAIQGAHLFVWNPLTNAEQRWECVEWLLERGDICFEKRDPEPYIYYHEFTYAQKPESEGDNGWRTIAETCPASEFPARAVAELQRRKA